ncbi:MAG: (2Fe-2S) ferredoxin domain-containing protein [Myxococcales bacterium]|nr:(2Fe-2S) ferredoxin domain-containing protein [Myxococcales bacterium]MCB9708323.1 (2Fe-2S) ferredoxin domain-containing protein [Myxococcales bacterium]
MPKRQQYLWVCENERPAQHPKGCCAEKKSSEIREALKKGIAKRGLLDSVRVCASSCLDLCWAGPAIAIMPEHMFYGHVTPNDVEEILDAIEAGHLVERLILPEKAFDPPDDA